MQEYIKNLRIWPSSLIYNTDSIKWWNKRYSCLLLKAVTETVQNEVKEQKVGLLSILLGALGTSLLGNILIGRGAIAKRQGRGIKRAGVGIVKTGYGSRFSKIKIDF